MKITNIRVTHVNVPFDAPFWWTAGTYPGASKSIIEVDTDEGVMIRTIPAVSAACH